MRAKSGTPELLSSVHGTLPMPGDLQKRASMKTPRKLAKAAAQPRTQTTGLNRRGFITRALAASAGAAVTVRAADATSAIAPGTGSSTVAPCSKGSLPTGKIGKLTISRLISGGNLISGWAHSRDLHYVPNLMRAYNTEEKVLETLQLLEEHGVNAIIADPIKKPKGIFARYWKERGGKMQWIAEGHPDMDDWQTNIQQSIDFGAAAVYVQGVKGDQFWKAGRMDLLGKCVEFIKSRGVPGGIGAHKLEVIIESEKNKYPADFYVKTLHGTNYWSSRRADQQDDPVDNKADNYWEMDAQKTITFMQEVQKPWIAFKILAAGAIRPEWAIKFAFQSGADFICVGMFDFQVEQNVGLVKSILPQVENNRERGWMA